MLKKVIVVISSCVLLYLAFCWIVVIFKPSFLITPIESNEWRGKTLLFRQFKHKLIESVFTPYGYIDALAFGNAYYKNGEYRYIGRGEGFECYNFEQNGNIIKFSDASEFISNTIDTFTSGEPVNLEILNYLQYDHEMRYHMTSCVVKVNKILIR